MELDRVEIHVPLTIACGVNPTLLMASFKEEFIVATEADLGGILC